MNIDSRSDAPNPGTWTRKEEEAMKPPKCKPFLPAARYREKVVRSLRYDGDTLSIEIQAEGFAFARVLFRRPAGFRVLDERDLSEFWNTYSEPNGWLYEVEVGGWLALESQRQMVNSPDFFPGLREYLLVDNKCISVLAVQAPEIQDLGSDPEGAGEGRGSQGTG
jgi:hypothetical protein